MIRTLAALFLGLAALAACAPASGELQPPEIAYGQDICEACGMLIDDEHYAAATLLTSGEYRKFDEIGDMLIYHMDHPEAQVKAWFVHDYRGGYWVRGEFAIYVSGDIYTPMGGGIVAFEKEADAVAYAADVNGSILTLDEARALLHATVHGH